MSQRKPLSKKVRFEVFKRDQFTCQYCGSNPPKVILHVDHVVPVAKGGGNDIDNLVTSCESCNLGKGANSLSSIPQTLVDKTKRMKELEDQLAGYKQIVLQKEDRIEQETWLIVDALEDVRGVESFNKKNLGSIGTFLRKIGFAETFEAARIANGRFPSYENKRFKYFCGICWNKAKELEGQS